MNNAYINKTLTPERGDATMRPLDPPEEYDDLSPAEQTALLEWIRLAIEPTRRAGPGTSYSIKHDFEADGFYVSNGEFKGAMLVAGYSPTPSSLHELNWRFAIKPRDKKRRGPSIEGAGYGLVHLALEQRAEFDALVAVAQREQAIRWSSSWRAF